MGSPASLAMVSNQSRRATLKSSSEPESLKQSDVMLLIIMALLQRCWCQPVIASAFSLDNISGVERINVRHGQLSISHKRHYPGLRSGQGIALRPQIPGHSRPLQAIIVLVFWGKCHWNWSHKNACYQGKDRRRKPI